MAVEDTDRNMGRRYTSPQGSDRAFAQAADDRSVLPDRSIISSAYGRRPQPVPCAKV